VGASYPWLFARHCGKNTVHLELAPGQVVRVRYHVSALRFVPGSIQVESR
jgi:hypothetical protein